MKHIYILVPHGPSSLPNIDGTHQIFSEVNKVRERMGKDPLFTVKLVGLTKETSQRNGMYIINPEALVKDVKKTDLIIIPAIYGDPKKIIEDNKEYIPWIIEQYKGGAEVASLCIGVFFLAATGLLEGKQCATHWAAANEFRLMYPGVRVVDDKIMTEEDGIYTSGGAYSYLNLLLYMVEKFAGREVAVIIAKAYSIDIDRSNQSAFIMFTGQKAHEDESIKKAQEYIENNFQD